MSLARWPLSRVLLRQTQTISCTVVGALRECLRQRLRSIPVYVIGYSFSEITSPISRNSPLPSKRRVSANKDTESDSKEVETVFSDLVQSMTPDASTRQALFELRRSLAIAKDFSEVSSALSNHSALLHSPDTWLFFLNILRHSPNPAHAIQAFDWKLTQPEATIKPQEYALVIRAAGKLGMLEKVRALYHGMPSRGVYRTIEVENAYMFAHSYDSTRNDCVEALSVFERLQETLDNRLKPNLTSYNIAMSCYSKLRYLKHLEKLFDDLLDAGISPSVETYNCLMLAYQRLGFWWRMEEVFCEMQKGSLKANELTFKTLVRGYATAGLLDRMENAYEAMLNHGYHARATTTDSMIAAYKKAGEFAKMEAILFSMRAKRRQKQISKLMIKGHACGGRIESMELLLDEMMRNGDVDFSPQLATIIVKAYFKKGEHGKIKDFVVTAEQHKWNLNRSFFNTLIYLYAKEEEHAEMKWHFGRMIASGCLPNDRTFQIMYRTYL